MSNLAPPTQTKTLAGGTTAAKMTGTRGYTTKNRNTAGVTTTGTRGPEDLGIVIIDGKKVDVKPQPLMLKKSDIEKKPAPSDMGKPVSGASG